VALAPIVGDQWMAGLFIAPGMLGVVLPVRGDYTERMRIVKKLRSDA